MWKADDEINTNQPFTQTCATPQKAGLLSFLHIVRCIDRVITCEDILLHVGKSRGIAALHSLQQHRHLIHLRGI